MHIFGIYQEWIKRLSNGRWIIGLLLVTWAVYGYMLLYSIPHLVELTGGMKPLDVLPQGYSSDYVQSLFRALGEDGRHHYLTHQIPIDLVYPALFIVTYSLLTFYLLRNAGTRERLATQQSVIPVLDDLSETTCPIEEQAHSIVHIPSESRRGTREITT